MRAHSFLASLIAGGAASVTLADNNLPQLDNVIPVRRQYGTTNTSGPLYELVDTYDASNFWEKFDFLETGPTASDDPTHGFVLYQNRSEAERLGLISTERGIASIQVDHTSEIRAPANGNFTGLGRKSVRIESVASYGEGLIVADFSHVPRPQCGSWPAFWTFSREPGWPNGGEIDIYEQWNTYTFNRQSIHMNSTLTGNCSFTSSPNPFAPAMANYLYAPDCNVTFPENVGCSSWDYEGPYGAAEGGIYALLLDPATNTLKLWTWHHDAAPSLSPPNPSEWGTPGLSIGGGEDREEAGCDVAATFKNQTIILNLEVCGDAISADEWVEGGCAEKTGFNGCVRFAAANPGAFEGVGFGVRSLRVWQVRR